MCVQPYLILDSETEAGVKNEVTRRGSVDSIDKDQRRIVRLNVANTSPFGEPQNNSSTQAHAVLIKRRDSNRKQWAAWTLTGHVNAGVTNQGSAWAKRP
jgi:hypothetical protein